MRVESLLCVPYRLGGASRAGSDCWGLVVLAYRDLGIELPPYSEALAGLERPPAGFFGARVAAESSRAWARIERAGARELDVVVMSVRAPSDHVGIVMADPRWLLTTGSRAGAHRTRWGRGSGWERRVSVWRYVGAGRAAAA